jgi:hypothetical protein
MMGGSFRSLAGAALATALVAAAPAWAQTAPATPAVAPDPAELAEARAVIDIMYPAAERGKIFDELLTSFNDQIRTSVPLDALQDDGLKAIVDEVLSGLPARQSPLMQKHTPALLEAMAVAYVNEFTLAELKDIRAFATTPSGGRYLSRATYLIGDPAVAEVNTAIMTESFAFADTVRGEQQHKVLAYLTEHPEVAEKLFGGAAQQ